jgi:hypothetical protein
MKWITRRSAHVDRTACPWLIKKFFDAEAEFAFVAPDADLAHLNGHTFDMRGAEYAHEDGKCTFQVMLERHDLCSDAALVELGRIIGDADVPPSRTRRHESAGLDAIMRGFQLGVPDDHEKLRLTAPVYDALYTYCQAKVAKPRAPGGAPRPKLRYALRVASHLDDDED